MKRNKTTDGITLVALIITIIVLLILAILTIQTVSGDGIIAHAKGARNAYEKSAWDEQKRLIFLGASVLTNSDVSNYLEKEFQKIDEEASISDVGNGYLIKLKNEKIFVDDHFNEYSVNEGDTEFWIYEDIDDGTIKLTGYNWAPGNEIIIPNFINDKPVKEIRCNFKGNLELTKMKISYGIEKLGGELFSGCTNLACDINLPDSIKEIGYGSFSSTKLTGDVNLKNVEVIPAHAFSHCTNLNGRLIMNPNGASVDHMSFYNCNQLKGTAVISQFASEGTFSFFGCASLENVILKEGMEIITDGGLKQCKSITSLQFPNSLKEIGAEAVRGCSKLKHITIPSTIEKIGRYAFYQDYVLEGTILLKSNIIIGENAFSETGNLKIEFVD